MQELTRRDFVWTAACGPAALAAPTAFAAPAVGIVQAVQGRVWSLLGRARRDLDEGASVSVGDRVETGAQARATLLLGADTKVRLGENARLTIDKYLPTAGGELTISSGPVLFDRPSEPPLPVRIRSPFGLIAVRGTTFFAGPSAGVFGVFVRKGEVTVSAAGARVVVGPGQGTNIARIGARPTPPSNWGDGRIREALASVT